ITFFLYVHASDLDTTPRVLLSSHDSESLGIGLGSSLEEVHDIFGASPDTADGCYYPADCDSCTGKMKLLFYSGFTVRLDQPSGSPNYFVTQMDITDSHYSLTSGLSVGTSIRKVYRILGNPDLRTIDGNTGGSIAHYSCPANAMLSVYFLNGVVTQ